MEKDCFIPLKVFLSFLFTDFFMYISSLTHMVKVEVSLYKHFHDILTSDQPH